MKWNRFLLFFSVLGVMALSLALFQSDVEAQADSFASKNGSSSTEIERNYSHRLIVELKSAPLTQSEFAQQTENGTLDVQSAEAQAYIAQLRAEQTAVMAEVQTFLPEATFGTFINELGLEETNSYQIIFNGFAVELGSHDIAVAQKLLLDVDNVKAVYRDYQYTATTYTSTALINAPAVWAQLGGQDDAGRGIKIASMDGGVHHEGSMFSGDGFSYPAGFPENGLGDAANNNGKIIASRAYFRSWDPPASGDENTWPGEAGTSHGVHTASTAGGNAVTDNYLGVDLDVTGVAPGAWIMSYRVFYASVNSDGSFYTAEGIAALEDIVADGADVVNNSWGGGPGSAGGEFDALDQALLNTWNAGVFVSMSAGNAGPNYGTGDHPSADYINVAASTDAGEYGSGRFNITAPTPVPTDLVDIAFATSSFGAPIAPGGDYSYEYVTAASIGDGSNFEGCNAWGDAGLFTGKAVVISRGACEFGVKVLNAEQAGAEFVVVHNHATGGDALTGMAGGAVGDQVTIPSVFVGNTAGLAIVDWYDTNGVTSSFELDTNAFFTGDTPDLIASFSSRGPGVGGTLKPDIAAPGVSIMAQGYTPSTVGEARHLGIGQANGTSMASPHIAGSAALLQSMYPSWSNEAIKSALMSTAKYKDIYNQHDNSPAQPLDMGAGRVDVAAATDPGVILSPPSLSFGHIMSGTGGTITVTVTSVSDETETYTITTEYTGNGFDAITDVAGVSASTSSITLAPGESAQVAVTFDSMASMGVGDNQGYVVMTGDNGHHAHMALWARVMAPPASADVLLMDASISGLLGEADYSQYYMDALTDAGYTYDYWNMAALCCSPSYVPEAAVLSAYDIIVLFTGDHYRPDGTFTVPTPLTALDMNRLTEYANQGGIIFVMGQDAAAIMNESFFHAAILGGVDAQDSVTGNTLPSMPVLPSSEAPEALQGVAINLTGSSAETVALTGGNENPPVTTDTSGTGSFLFDVVSEVLYYDITINAGATPVTITAAHIHSGTVGVNGSVVDSIFPFTSTVYLTDTMNWSGSIAIPSNIVDQLLSGGHYVNIHSTDNTGGELRGQIEVGIAGDGAENAFFMDEFETQTSSPWDVEESSFINLLYYPDASNWVEDGIVAMAHRDNPTLEYPGTSYAGRSIYTAFGLESVNDYAGYTSKADLLTAFINWATDEPTISFSASTMYTTTTLLTEFEADMDNGVSYRWDFGDGTPYVDTDSNAIASHTYQECGTYTVRVEGTNAWGNRAVTEMTVDVTQCAPDETSSHTIYLPVIIRSE